ncbi:MAG: hypothetical protein K6F37_04210 [Lachnospiraceae bacterium]|nr:hypothetical protein [Lachnospiraceae bacterium]
MYELDERYTGKVVYDESSQVLTAGRITLSAADIEDCVYCSSVTAVFGRRDDNPEPSSAAIGFRIKEAISHPGKLFSATKTKNLLLRFSDAEAAYALYNALPLEERDLVLPAYTYEEYPIKQCIVEAKKGMNNYTRGGTPGSRPYSKPGLVAPQIKPEIDIDSGSVTIHYTGLNIADHESLWFRDHPHDQFFFNKCTDITYLLNLYDDKTDVSARFERYDIERNENASGLWFVKFDNSYTSICDALRWVNTLIFSYQSKPSSEKETTDDEIVSIAEDIINEVKPSKEMLYDALRLLSEADIISQRDLTILRERIDKKKDI